MTTGSEWWRPIPKGASSDAIRILAARGVRAFGDGVVALLLPVYLLELGFSAFAIGTIVCATLIGTALLTLWVGIIANRHPRRRLLLAASLLMVATGVGFAVTTAFWPLLVIAFVGTMNPTSGDASVFLPLEQTVLTQTRQSAPANRALRALQPDRLGCRGTRRARCSRARPRGEEIWIRPRCRDARDVRAVRGARNHLIAALPTALAGHRGDL